MTCRVIKKQWHNFIYGLEHHNGLYWLNIWNQLAPAGAPPMPIPAGMFPAIPESIHGVQYAATHWPSMDDKSHPNILADGSPVLSRNHTIKRTPHCPPGINVAVVSTIVFSTSTFKLGVASVQGNNSPLASTAAGPVFVTIECADPMSTPTGGGLAPGTVHVSPTTEDWQQAAIEWALAGTVEVLATFVFGKIMEGPVGDFVAKRVGGVGRYAHRWWRNSSTGRALSRQAYDLQKQEAAQQAAREATEKLIRENGYDSFLSNEARRRGANPSSIDEATKQAIDEAFEREVKEAGENAMVDAGEKGAGPAAKDATEQWFEGQRKGGGPYSAPPNTQPSPTKAHGAKAERTAVEREKEIFDEKLKDYSKFPEAFGGDQFKSSSGDGTSGDIEEAAKDWSGVPETAE